MPQTYIRAGAPGSVPSSVSRTEFDEVSCRCRGWPMPGRDGTTGEGQARMVPPYRDGGPG